jgi:AraC-like DNA-binding protein
MAGAGRILLWNGGSLWIGSAGGETELHSHHAVQISLSLSGAGLRLRAAHGGWGTYRAAIIAANQDHAFDAGGNFVANVFVEPESHTGQILQERCVANAVCRIADDALTGELATLLAAYQRTATDETLVAAGRAVIAALTKTTVLPQATLDPRIKRALDLIRARIGDESIALADIAEAAHLSPDRFRHLFLEQTGIRFRPYVLWLRMEVALAAYAARSNMTDSAQAGGFADSAHFSRSFKSMFGIVPSALQID